MKEVIFATLRSNKGPTGGPGGVLYMLKETIGPGVSANINAQYWFNPIDIKKNLKGLLDTPNKLLFKLKAYLNKEKYFIVHEIDSAAILADLKIKYSLVFHNQGPLVQEWLNFGRKLSNKDIRKIQERERKAFINAVSLHFPSGGAANMYFDNEYSSCKREEVTLGDPLYNTIPIDDKVKVEGIDKIDGLTLFSLGTLTEAKGQDKTLEFVERLVHTYQGKVRYIFVGRGPLKDALISKCEAIKLANANFEYIYIPRLAHPEIMYIHSIADVYIMRHRLSIFDFATLEAMIENSAIVLSPVGGNMDFNKEDNIIFVDDDIQLAVDKLCSADIDLLKRKNKTVFDKYFSKNAFREEYTKVINHNAI